VSSALRSPRLQLAIRLLLGSVFVYASLDKIADPAGFARVVYQWQILGPAPANLVAVTLPWIELVAGLMLIAGAWKRDAAAVLGVLLVVFIVAALVVLVQGTEVDNCGCTSVAAAGPAPTWPPEWMRGVGWFLITRNIVLLAGALLLACVEPARTEPS
jgi:uncharacterized membrane protein YphA (DoxX/SURF4 family)